MAGWGAAGESCTKNPSYSNADVQLSLPLPLTLHDQLGLGKPCKGHCGDPGLHSSLTLFPCEQTQGAKECGVLLVSPRRWHPAEDQAVLLCSAQDKPTLPPKPSCIPIISNLSLGLKIPPSGVHEELCLVWAGPSLSPICRSSRHSQCPRPC